MLIVDEGKIYNIKAKLTNGTLRISDFKPEKISFD